MITRRAKPSDANAVLAIGGDAVVTTGLNDFPDPPELVLAVRELLAGEVLEHLEGRVWFRVRIAMNLLDIVARQLATEAEDVEVHRQGLDRIGFDNDAALAEAIRSGALDDRYEEVADVLRDDVWHRVSVVNPRYRAPYDSARDARETVSLTE